MTLTRPIVCTAIRWRASTPEPSRLDQKTIDGTDAPVENYAFLPEEGFATSPIEENGGDDWTAVRVRGKPNEKWGFLDLRRASPKLHDEVAIVKLALYRNQGVHINVVLAGIQAAGPL